MFVSPIDRICSHEMIVIRLSVFSPTCTPATECCEHYNLSTNVGQVLPSVPPTLLHFWPPWHPLITQEVVLPRTMLKTRFDCTRPMIRRNPMSQHWYPFGLRFEASVAQGRVTWTMRIGGGASLLLAILSSVGPCYSLRRALPLVCDKGGLFFGQ